MPFDMCTIVHYNDLKATQEGISGMKKVTIQDIADELGVSRNTVSKAINNAEGLAEATRARILQKAVEMGYKQFSYIREQANLGLPSGQQKRDCTRDIHQHGCAEYGLMVRFGNVKSTGRMCPAGAPNFAVPLRRPSVKP